MFSSQFSENMFAEANTSSKWNLRVSFIRELAPKLNSALDFIFNKAGFVPLEEFIFINGLEEATLKGTDGSTLIISLKTHEVGGHIKNITFHTDDCLRDYHKYIMSGLEFTNRPEYSTAGLQVDFIDNEDNCYTLLEERDYTES